MPEGNIGLSLLWAVPKAFFEVNSSEQERGLARCLSGKESACQCRRHKRWRFDAWVGKMGWRRKW